MSEEHTAPAEMLAEEATPVCSRALWERHTAFDGLAGMQVEDILQDRRGYLWVATADGGISRFDGVHFDNLTRADGLPHLSVMSLAETKDGRLWCGTLGGGVAAYDGSGFRVYGMEAGLPSDEVLRLRVEVDDSVLVMTRAGVARLVDGRCTDVMTHVAGASTGPVYDMATDPTGRTWLATWGRGVISTDGLRLSDVPGGEQLPAFAWCLVTDAEGRIWVGSCYLGVSARVFCYDPREERVTLLAVPAEEGATPSEMGVRSIRVDARGRVWLVHRGVLVLEDQQWRRMALPEQTAGVPEVQLTYQDREGNVWVGYWGGGLGFCDPASVHWLGRDAGLPDVVVRSLAADRKGRLWIGTLRGKALVADGRVLPRDATGEPHGEPVLSLCADDEGRIWAGDGHGRVHCYDADGVPTLRAAGQGSAAWALCARRRGGVWVAHEDGTAGWLDDEG